MYIKKGINNINEAYNIAEQGNQKLSGNISISNPSTFNEFFLIKAIEIFKKEYPEVSFYLDSSSRTIDIHANGIDLVIRSSPLPNSQLVARKIFEQHRILVCSPEYLTKIPIPQHIHDLSALNSLAFSYPGYNSTFWILETIKCNESLSKNP
ncbi:LysR substrate-binding domain-containing protein [Photorhabdus heterorhabditis]|uniref:LysR substrate-binding domain-containing protein n=1 Tax=Photorhabdus heterorhabditis TaxID=880156 RepID=UPI0030DAEC7C